ncbi:MAG: GNAT family N-acetyltransferase [Solirubrobacterales bacterium]
MDEPSLPRGITLRHASTVAELDDVEALWRSLQAHHAEVTPDLGPRTPKRPAADSWRMRRDKYVRWLEDPDTFFIIAETEGAPVGYAFVTVGPGHASWATGERVAELETLSVLAGRRGAGIGHALLAAVWERLARIGVEDMQVTTASANVDSHRFYEREGLTRRFFIFYGKRAP